MRLRLVLVRWKFGLLFMILAAANLPLHHHLETRRKTLIQRRSKKWLPLVATLALGAGLVACGSDAATEETDETTAEVITDDTAAETTDAPAEETGETFPASWDSNFAPWSADAAPIDCRPKEGPLKAA